MRYREQQDLSGRTDERGGRTARKHNGFADTVGWQRIEKRK